MLIRLTQYSFTIVTLLVVLGYAFVHQWSWGLLLLGPLLFPETIAADSEIITVITKICIQVLCALLLCLPFFIRGFWGSVVERFYPAEAVRRFRTLLVRNSGLFFVNILLTPILVLLYAFSFSYAQVDEEIAMIGMVLSMAGIGIFLLPFIWPIAWFVTFFLLADHVYQTMRAIIIRLDALYRPRITNDQTGESSVMSTQRSLFPINPVSLPPVSWSFLLGCAVAVVALLGITSAVSQGVTAEAVTTITLTVVVVGIYVTARRTFSRHSLLKAWLLTAVHSVLWFVGSIVVAGVTLAILGLA